MPRKKEGTTTRSRSSNKTENETDEVVELVSNDMDDEKENAEKVDMSAADIEVEAMLEGMKEETIVETVGAYIPAPVEDDAPVSWRKIGGGSFYMITTDKNGRRSRHIIKKNQTFTARPSEIPVAFLDVVKPLSEIPSVAKHEAPISNATVYEVVPHPGKPEKFDVINATTKKALNSQPLDKGDADDIVKKIA